VGAIGLAQGPPADVTAVPPRADQAAPPAPPGQPRPPRRLGRPSSLRSLVALTAAIALIVGGGVIYLVTAHSPARQAAQHKTTTKNRGPVMLGAGKTGKLSAIPWGLVKAGWTLAEVSGAAAGTNQPGTITTYLVDPLGGRYQIKSWSPGVTPQLLGWSGDGLHALYAVPNDSGSGSATYQLLSLQTGEMASLPLPTGVTAVGFTRPDGLAIVAVKQNPDAFKLQRYDLQGNFQATIGSLPRKPGSPDWLPGCGTECGALSSPNGDTDVWGVAGDQMQVVGNADGKVTKLSVPGGASCVPLAWRDDATVLASCSVAGQPSAGQLWLVPSDGSTAPTQLTQASGSPSGSGDLTGAWQTAGTTYVGVVNFRQCPGAPSGPGGLSVVPVSGGSLQQPITVKGATNNHTSIVSASGGKLLVVAQTGCPGTSSLLWLNPPTGATTTLLAGEVGQVGVLAAVPFGGLAPTATNGQ
jgi:TolB protein